MRHLHDMVAFITGGTRGIGRAMVERLARHGARVYTCGRNDRDIEKLSADTRDLDGEVIASTASVTVRDRMAEFTDQIREKDGRLDLLVNNAGVLGPREPLEDVPVETWRQTLEVNLTGVFIATKTTIPLLRESDDGMVLNISSSVGREGRGRWGPYAVSKHGVEGMTDTLADELAPDGMTVVSANPGGTATDMRADAYPDEDPSTLPTPDQVAATLVLLARTLEDDQSGNRYDCRDLFEQTEAAEPPAPDQLPTAD